MSKVITKHSNSIVINSITLSLNNLQEIVSGYIATYNTHNFTVIYNSLGRNLNLPQTVAFGRIFHGTIVICRTEFDVYVGLTEPNITYILSKFV